MFIPNGFIPSGLARTHTYDPEGRLHEHNLSRDSVGGVGNANSLYATDAEMFETKAPFIAANMAKDRKRRNYIIQPGGAALYKSEDDTPKRAGYFPESNESFGHNTLETTRMANSKVHFSVGGNR